jgi:hypothetical protein
MVNQSNLYKTKSIKNNILKIFHQNIGGLRNKCNEILCHLKEQTLHILCFTEHHLEGNEIVHLNLDNYILGAYYSRKHLKKGGDSLKIATINLDNYCYDKDIEACAVCVNIASSRICILSVYRSPYSNYKIFL